MLRIQCRQNPAIEALRAGLDELKRVCDVLMEKFSTAIVAGDHEIVMSKEIWFKYKFKIKHFNR